MLLAVLQRVYSQTRYTVATCLIAFAVLSLALLLPYQAIVTQVLFGSASVFTKLKFIGSLYGTLGSDHTWYGIINILLLAVLFGVNIALLTYYIRRRQEASRSTHLQLASVVGFVSSIFGIGCAACGSVIVTGVLSVFGASGLLLLLPFGGAEFGVLGLVLLLVSIYYLIKRINDPIVCPLNSKDL
jgi:uncharacterized membrane-anchored protein